MKELERMKRVSDLMVTSHSILRDRFNRKALILDILILVVSAWLTAMIFIDPKIEIRLYPPNIDREIFVGLLSISAFILSIIQLRVDWKSCAEAHRRASDVYAALKKEINFKLTLKGDFSDDEYQRIYDQYNMTGNISVPIPESNFIELKKSHKIKKEISKYLDDKPGSSLLILRIRIWMRDNFGFPKT